MRLGLVAERLLDWVALASGRVPTPIIDALPGLIIARALMAATRLGIFDALAASALPAEGLATLCATDPVATEKLLNLLVAQRYLQRTQGRYSLTATARRWLLHDGPQSIHAYLRYNELQWDWLGRTEAFVQTGRPIRFHQEMAAADWDLYQQGMLAIARLTAPEVAWRIPVPSGANQLLDIGGAHGAYSAALCRRHPHLSATILDLPEAIEYAAPLLAEMGMGERVRQVAGDALTTDLGIARYDVVFIANLVHHFDAATNCALMQRVARALAPGGLCVIQEGIRPGEAEQPRQLEACGDFFFALTSEAGLYSFAEMSAWQRAAGLAPLHPIRLLTGPGQGLQMAHKPTATRQPQRRR
ncbi:MAG: class I SAM-dependent methyltransferase [Ktedonobacterales bacterium]|nr:class I SAM-dependent methyltransferase [Ktedonobacterales bacterium]